MRQQRTTIIAGVIGAVLIAVSIIADGRITADDFGRVGAMLCIGAFVGAMWQKAGRPQQAAYELGWTDCAAANVRDAAEERERGFREGRRIARPVVVPFPGNVASRGTEPASDHMTGVAHRHGGE